MAEFTFRLDQYTDAVRVDMRASFDVIEAVDWCATDEVAGTFSYGSIWHPDRVSELTQWEFRFTDSHAAFDFKLRWC